MYCLYSLGPTVGSFLYSYGGFGLPYYVVGSFVTTVAFALLILIPKVDVKGEEERKDDKKEENVGKRSLNILDVIKVTRNSFDTMRLRIFFPESHFGFPFHRQHRDLF